MATDQNGLWYQHEQWLPICVPGPMPGRPPAPKVKPVRKMPNCRLDGTSMLGGEKRVKNDTFLSVELLSSAKTVAWPVPHPAPRDNGRHGPCRTQPRATTVGMARAAPSPARQP
jgi:hypothetical protein